HAGAGAQLRGAAAQGGAGALGPRRAPGLRPYDRLGRGDFVALPGRRTRETRLVEPADPGVAHSACARGDLRAREGRLSAASGPGRGRWRRRPPDRGSRAGGVNAAWHLARDAPCFVLRRLGTVLPARPPAQESVSRATVAGSNAQSL